MIYEGIRSRLKGEKQDMETNAASALGTERVGRLLFKLALPAVTAQIINVLYNVVDRMYIGHIEPVDTVGKMALTGVGVCMPLILIISAFAALVAMGAAPRASIFLGKQDLETAERILGNSTVLLVGVALLLTPVFQIWTKDMLLAFGASPNTVAYGVSYMRIYSLGTLFVQLTLGLNAFISAQGFAKTSMLTVLIGAICNIVLDPIFIFLFKMGVAGAALATVLSQAVSCIWFLRFLTGSKTVLRLRWETIRLEPKIFLPCIALGLSPFIMQSTESLVSICFNASLQKYGGDLAVGAMTVLASVNQFSILPLQGLTQGAQPIASYNFGARNKDRVRQTFRLLLISCVVYSILFWLALQLFPQVFVLVFNSESQLVAFASRALRIYMLASCIFGIQIACQQTFISLGNAKCSLFLALLRKVILLIPLIYIMPCLMVDQTTAVFLAEPIADILAVTTTAILFAVQFRKALAQL